MGSHSGRIQSFLALMTKDDNSLQLVAIDDDDKMHYNYNVMTNSDGIKKDHHAKDNWHGFTVHTSCYSATDKIIQAGFQRDGENVQQSTPRGITNVFGKHTGRLTDDALNNISILGMDRGY
jgi:hypothetical protein